MQRNLKKFGFIATAAAGLFLGQINTSIASDEKVYSASTCHPSYNYQAGYFSYGTGSKITNTYNISGYVTCPIVRDDVLGVWESLSVRVDDRHSTQSVNCNLYIMDAWGGLLYNGWRQSTGTGVQNLVFNNPGNIVNGQRTPYAIRCAIPGKDASGSISALLHYVFAE